ncbi:Uncharacterised protein [Vibrio cholerae]|nr:Uncharacterised protein [Vibrio cholerae]
MLLTHRTRCRQELITDQSIRSPKMLSELLITVISESEYDHIW